jgi:hypothetical protein
VEQRARLWFGLTAAVELVTMVIQVRAVAQLDSGFFATDAQRIANVFCYFTIWSNLLVGFTCAALAVRLDRPSTAFRAAYLAAVVMIAVTFVVVIAVLDDISDYEGKAATADFLTHKLVPVLAVVGWVVFGPRGLIDRKVIAGAVTIPVAWLAFTLLRGPFASDFYPYSFVDVAEHGYAQVLLNVGVVTLLFLGLMFGARALDPKLPGVRPASSTAA